VVWQCCIANCYTRILYFALLYSKNYLIIVYAECIFERCNRSVCQSKFVFLYELRRLQDFITVFFSVWTTNVAFELLTGKFGRHES